MSVSDHLDEVALNGGFDFDIPLKRRLDILNRNGAMDAVTTEFALEGKKGKVRQSGQGGSPQPRAPPEQRIQESRDLVNSDPHLAEGVNTLVDYLVGSGLRAAPRNIPYTDAKLEIQDIAELKVLVETSRFEIAVTDWVWHAIVDGTAYLEINWENEVFKPRLLPPTRMSIQTDEYGDVIGYVMESEGEDDVEFGKYDVAHLGFWKHPSEDYYSPIVEWCNEQADMLRDMEIDMARFVATKAFPPILWKLGSEESEWNPAEISGWMDEVSKVEPDSMLVGPHDVEAEAVGVADSTTTSGAMELGPTFEHFQTRIATGLGIPYFLLNGDSNGQAEAVAQMPKFDRRIQRLRTVIRDAVENQIFRSLYYHPNLEENEGELVPKLEFGEHSSEEERLETKEALQLLNNGVIKPEAFAQRVGIDPETELPDFWKELDVLEALERLAGLGDKIQNPSGGSPTDTSGGVDSAGGEVKTRQNPERPVTDDSRPQRDVSNE